MENLMKKTTKKAPAKAKVPVKEKIIKEEPKKTVSQPQGRLLTADGWKKLMLPDAKKIK